MQSFADQNWSNITTSDAVFVFNEKERKMKPLRFFTISIIISILVWGQHCSSPDKDKNSDETEASLSPEEQKIALGKKVYKNHCVACHGMNGKMGFNGAKDLTESELTLEERKILIAYGRGSMMAFKSILSAEEIEAAANYSMTFNKPDE